MYQYLLVFEDGSLQQKSDFTSEDRDAVTLGYLTVVTVKEGKFVTFVPATAESEEVWEEVTATYYK